jgi:hypothetical protein
MSFHIEETVLKTVMSWMRGGAGKRQDATLPRCRLVQPYVCLSTNCSLVS